MKLIDRVSAINWNRVPDEKDAEVWDRQLEEDVRAGRLDALAEEALRDLREGCCTDL